MLSLVFTKACVVSSFGDLEDTRTRECETVLPFSSEQRMKYIESSKGRGTGLKLFSVWLFTMNHTSFNDNENVT